MLTAVADTHSLIWYLFDDPRLSPAARSAFENARSMGDEIVISSISVIEVIYLCEKGRIPSQAVIDALR